jgi:hypothetical protein
MHGRDDPKFAQLHKEKGVVNGRSHWFLPGVKLSA